MRQEVYIKFAAALNNQRLSKEASGGSAMKQLLRLVRRARVKASPKVNADNWGTFDPRRLFVKRRSAALTVRNIGGGSGGTGSGSGAAYQGGAGVDVPTYSDLGSTTTLRETTRLSPARILAALGLAGAGGVAASAASGSPVHPKISPRLAALIAGGTALAAGGTAAGIYAAKRSKKDKTEE